MPTSALDRSIYTPSVHNYTCKTVEFCTLTLPLVDIHAHASQLAALHHLDESVLQGERCFS